MAIQERIEEVVADVLGSGDLLKEEAEAVVAAGETLTEALRRATRRNEEPNESDNL